MLADKIAKRKKKQPSGKCIQFQLNVPHGQVTNSQALYPYE